MKVTVERYGGFAAGISRPVQVIDTAKLPDASAAELKRLLTAANRGPRQADGVQASAGTPESGRQHGALGMAAHERPPGRVRDGMTYTVTVEEEDEPLILTESDCAMTPEFAALLDWINRHLAEKK